MRPIYILIILSLSLQGCATLSKNECLTANWQTIGFEDGTQGHSRDRIGSHRQACADYGVAPDLRNYQEGYDKGVLSYCTLRNGYSKGKSGVLYNDICPASVEEVFLQGYDAGRELYLETSESNKLHSELQGIVYRLEELEHHIYEKEQMLFTDSIPKEQRKRMYRTISELKEDHYHLRLRYDELYDEIDEVDDRLNFLRRKNRPYE